MLAKQKENIGMGFLKERVRNGTITKESMLLKKSVSCTSLCVHLSDCNKPLWLNGKMSLVI